MSSGLLIFLIAAGAVAFFVIGLSLTIIFKGHYMDSEIGENRHMKKRGIRCAAQQMRAEEENLRGECASDDGCAGTAALLARRRTVREFRTKSPENDRPSASRFRKKLLKNRML